MSSPNKPNRRLANRATAVVTEGPNSKETIEAAVHFLGGGFLRANADPRSTRSELARPDRGKNWQFSDTLQADYL
jgi:hypothetical protein